MIRLLRCGFLALMLVGCALPRPATLPAAPMGASALLEGYGRAAVQVRWPEHRTAQAIPYDAMTARLTAYDASGSFLASASIRREDSPSLGQGALDLPIGSGRWIKVELDSQTDTAIASGSSEAFAVARNQTVPVSVTMAPVVRTRFGPINAFSKSGGTTPSPGLGSIWSLAMGPDDTLYVADFSNHAVRAVAPNGEARVVVGQVTDTATQSQGVASTVSPDNSGDGGPARDATLRRPHGVYAAPNGDLFIADALVTSSQMRIRFVPAASGERFGAPREAGHIYTLHTLAGSFAAAGMVMDTDGALLFTQSYKAAHEIMRLTTAGTASLLIGGGASTADGALPASASLVAPWGLALDPLGNLLFGEYQGARVRMLCRVPGRYYGMPTEMQPGRVYTVMDGASLKSQLGLELLPYPRQLALDRQGNLYLAENMSHSVFRIDRLTGAPSRVAGGLETSTTVPLGDGGLAASASLNLPHGLAIDSRNRLFIGDTSNGRVRWLHL